MTPASFKIGAVRMIAALDIGPIREALTKAFPGCIVTISGHPHVGITVSDGINVVTTVYHDETSVAPDMVVKTLWAGASTALREGIEEKKRKAAIWKAVCGAVG